MDGVVTFFSLLFLRFGIELLEQITSLDYASVLPLSLSARTCDLELQRNHTYNRRKMLTQPANLTQARNLLLGAKNLVVLTGAGVSGASGIPTFRGAGGLWRRFRSEELATPEAFRRNPSVVWAFYHWRRERKFPTRSGFDTLLINLQRAFLRLMTRNILQSFETAVLTRLMKSSLGSKPIRPRILPPRS